MKKLVKKLFLDRSLYYKFNLVFMLVALLPISILAYASYRMIDNRLLKDAHERLEIGLKAAWTEYYIRADQMRYGMLQAASQEEIKIAVRSKGNQYLADVMEKWKGRRPYVDIWIIVDERGKVISRLNSGQKGDSVEINGLVEKALVSGKPQISTEILHEDLMDREGEEFHRRLAAPKNTGMKETVRTGSREMEGDEMAIVAVTPVIDDNRRTIGAIITADVLNNDPHLPDAVSNKLPWLFTTVSLDGLRISTNIPDNNGRNALWTQLPAEIAARVAAGEKVAADWTFDRSFVSIIDPIKDNRGRVIGSLDVSIMKSHIWDIQGENKRAITAVMIFGIVLSLLISLITTRQIIRPVKLLKQKAISFAKSEAGATIPLPAHTADEIGMMDFIYDNMMADLKKRNEERNRHFRELEEKNKQLEELNDRLTEMNEKLEVSYEELQAQTEELNATNEEIRVFNEEMAAKNAGLLEANERIRKEKEEQKALMERLAQAEKLSSIGELVAGVAHELNNPLSVIMGFSEILLDKGLPEKAEKQMKMINEAAHRSKRVIENLLTFARTHKPEKKYIDLNRIIRYAVELKGYQLKVDNIEVELNLDQELPQTLLDENQIEQVFLNLINNAHDAILEKGRGGRITIVTSSEGDAIRTRISDTGKGMPEDVVKRIFDPFFTTKEVGKGTGLGLSISYGIIKEHRGDIYAESRLNEGTAFVIELPVVRMIEENREAGSDTGEQPAAKERRVLVIDDEPGMLILLKEQLLSLGHHVDTAGTGDEAFAMLQKTSYDLITTDIKMCGMNGKEFYGRLKSIRPDMADKVIFISGDTVSKETREFLKETGRPLIKKPFSMKEFRSFITKHL